jgi:hypothetical protein
MSNEEIVQERLEKHSTAPLKFGEPRREDYYWDNDYIGRVDKFNKDLEILKNQNSVIERVKYIIKIGENTYHMNGRYQCHAYANRSARDIYRIYIYYFGEIDIFSILRALYKLAVEERYIQTYRCPTVRKQVFWLYERFASKALEIDNKADLGVPVREWKDIGLNM